ncbi:MAG: endonuclease/exonuclease/phosphatase family protein [Candidatus Eisenbacteria sp.]|nr:endonuclease/exonuclease/phosphatase family protein [Candidatus Eisenbacteria bacterium]
MSVRAILGLFGSVCMLVGSPAAHAESDTLDILTYNIYWGGQPHDPIFERGDEWLAVIKSRNPDVILIQEANGWLGDDLNLIAAYVDSLNNAFPEDPPYEGLVGDARSRFDLALISRIPIVDFETFTSVDIGRETVAIAHAFIHATLKQGSESVHVIGVHFKPGAYRWEREREAQALLSILDGLPQGETVWIGGDFNSYSPVDCEPGSPTPPDYGAGAPPAETKGWEPVGYLLDRGFSDAFRTLHPGELGYTQSTESFWPFGGPIQRVDFLLCSPDSPWDLIMAETLADSLGHIGSDHYAVHAVYTRAPSACEPACRDLTASCRLHAWPNPTGGWVRIECRLPQTGESSLAVYAVDGRLVRRLFRGIWDAGTHPIGWDGCDMLGQEVPRGWYLLRLHGNWGDRKVPILRLGPH